MTQDLKAILGEMIAQRDRMNAAIVALQALDNGNGFATHRQGRTRHPDGVTMRILAFFVANDGEHSAAEVARSTYGIGSRDPMYQTIYKTLRRLAENNEIGQRANGRFARAS